MTALAALTSEQVDALSKEASFKDALHSWIVGTGTAINWNSWQSGFALLRARYERIDAAAQPGSLAFSTWCQRLWYELSEGVYGPDWKDLLKIGRVRPVLPQSGRPQDAQDARARGATALGGLRPTAQAATRPTPTSLPSRPRGLLPPQGAEALGGVYTRLGPEGVAPSLRGSRPPELSVAVPVSASA